MRQLSLQGIAVALSFNRQVFQSLMEVALYTSQRSNNDLEYLLPASAITWRALCPGLYNGQPSPSTCSQYWCPTAQLYICDFTLVCSLSISKMSGQRQWIAGSVYMLKSHRILEVFIYYYALMYIKLLKITITNSKQITQITKEASMLPLCMNKPKWNSNGR